MKKPFAKFHFKGDRFLVYFFVCLAVLLISLLVCLLYLRHIQTELVDSAEEKYQSYLLGAELRQSSDDLTKMVRIYIVTGEPKYKQFFNEILAIRNGTSPRPERYNEIYWDLVVDKRRPRPFGPPLSLRQMMVDHGFTSDELNLLESSQNTSDTLASLEQRAMAAIEATPPDRDLALKLVFGEDYMKTKAQIMAPIQEFINHVEARTKKKTDDLELESTEIILLAIILAAGSTVVMLISIYKALFALQRMTQENELLLLNVLPSPIADRLKGGEEPIADEFTQASVLFADIVKFTELTYRMGPQKTVKILNDLFDLFDDECEKFGVEKVKTIGDSYMAVSGVPTPSEDHAVRLADFALAIEKKLAEFNQANQFDLKVRMGMNSGPVVAGVIGHKKFVYDLWGDVVNIASRMEATAPEGAIQIPEKMAMLLKDSFIVQERDVIEIKGKGPMKTFLLKGRK